MPGHVAAKAEAPPPRILERASIARPVALAPQEESAPELLDAMEAWNRAGEFADAAGLSRPLPETIRADFRPPADRPRSIRTRCVHVRSPGRFSGERRSPCAARPPSACISRMCAFPPTRGSGPMAPPAASPRSGSRLVSASGDLWTPLIFGETAFLEAESPAGGGEGFSITDVVEVRLGAATTPPCLVDAACVTSSDFDAIEPARRAVAFLAFMENNLLYACTGTLLNDTNSSGTPYLLTAAHCLRRLRRCRRSWPSRITWTRPATARRRILRHCLERRGHAASTSANSDYTFLRLNDAPGDRAFMGWDQRPNSVRAGTTIYRISHPDPGGTASPQSFAESVVDTNNNYVCIGVGSGPLPLLENRRGGDWRGQLGHGRDDRRGLRGGAALHAMPQRQRLLHAAVRAGRRPLLAHVRRHRAVAEPRDRAARRELRVDPVVAGPGQAIAFGDTSTGAPTSWSWTLGDGTGSNVQSPVKAYAAAGTYTVTLTVSNGSGSSSVSKAITVAPCAASATALCLDLGRFRSRRTGRSPIASSGDGNAVSLTADTGYFWFFDPTNVEVITKVLEGCAVDQFRWVFASGLTNVGVTLTVVDAVTQQSKTYTNVVGTAFQPVQDTKAFACN